MYVPSMGFTCLKYMYIVLLLSPFFIMACTIYTSQYKSELNYYLTVYINYVNYNNNYYVHYIIYIWCIYYGDDYVKKHLLY